MPVKNGTRFARDENGQRVAVEGRLPWPGIITGYNARCSCSWAMNWARGYASYEVKFVDEACPEHGEEVRRGRS